MNNLYSPTFIDIHDNFSYIKSIDQSGLLLVFSNHIYYFITSYFIGEDISVPIQRVEFPQRRKFISFGKLIQ